MKDLLTKNAEEILEDEELNKLLGMNDEDFLKVAPQFITTFRTAFNDSNMRYEMLRTIRANGQTPLEYVIALDRVIHGVDEALEGLSQPKIDFVKDYMALMAQVFSDLADVPGRLVSVPIQRLNKEVPIPKYARKGDAGMDVVAAEEVTINPGETKIVPTGLAVAIPLGFEMEVRPRSGLSLRSPLRIANSPGTIDAGYRDEIGIIVTNISPSITDLMFKPDGTIDGRGTEYGPGYTIPKGTKIAQLVLKEIPFCSFYEVENIKDLGEESDNLDRKGGFGSTGE